MTECSSENQVTIPLLLPERLTGLADLPGVQLFFTTRRGGVSQGSYDSLNLGGHVGDDAAAVARNRARVAALWGERIDRICYLNQVHGTTTVEQRGEEPVTAVDADAWVTQQTGMVLAILTADCAPVLLADAEARVIGAAHAGWRGGLAGVLESCLDAMLERGARREHIQAVIGPCIHQTFYTVDEAFLAAFDSQSDKISINHKKFFSKQNNTGRMRFDLPGYLQERLKLYGLLKERIHDVKLCTYSESNDFFSHRRATHQGSSPCGRQMGGIFLF
ncbi:MAG: peptidoglycan editing factor PgeF [Magnetococcales bacterium]|nr:peptidoglycan editing factor PgeF [Magnetococcales bacterium]